MIIIDTESKDMEPQVPQIDYNKPLIFFNNENWVFRDKVIDLSFAVVYLIPEDDGPTNYQIDRAVSFPVLEFGDVVGTLTDGTPFVMNCRQLRVLNALRMQEIDIRRDQQ